MVRNSIQQIVPNNELLSEDDMKNEDFSIAKIYNIFDKPAIEILQYLVSLNLLNNSCECLSCASNMNLIMKKKSLDGYFWKCNGCKKECSVRYDSYFDSCKKSFKLCFLFLYHWSNDMKQIEMVKELNIDKNTASDWCLDMRELCQYYFLSKDSQIGGYNSDGTRKIVEIDESLFFRRKYNRGRYKGSQWVFGGIERGTKKCFLVSVANRSRDTLMAIINKRILPGSLIISDKWKAYDTIGEDGKYLHDSVNHSLSFVSPDDPKVHTQNIENCWLHAKRKLKIQSGTQLHLLDGYLYEFMLKFSCTNRTKIINNVIIELNKLINK